MAPAGADRRSVDLLTQKQAREIAAEIAARGRVYQSNPSTGGGRVSGYHSRCPQIHALTPQVQGEVYDQARASLLDTHAYNQLLVAALISVAAVCLLTPMDLANTLALAAITVATCSAALAFNFVYVRRAVKLIAIELAKLGF